MDLEEMKQIWKRQKSEEEMMTQEQFMMILNNKLISMDEKIKKRDWLEISVAAITAVVCIIILFYTDSMWFRLGCFTLIAACILVTYKLQTAKKKAANQNIRPNQNFSTHLKEELAKMKAQQKLLKSVLWWYLMPIFIGLLFFVIGSDEPLWSKLVYMTIVVLLYAYIWWMNRKAVSNTIEPIIEDLQEALAFIKNDKS